jgi:O-antigen/teichoic acid export membrane protein
MSKINDRQAKKLIVNFGSLIAFQLLTIGIGMISTPLLLEWLGDDRYGAFRAASDWGNYINLLELGLSGSLISLLAKAVSAGDRKHTYHTLIAGIKAYLKITILFILAGIGLGIFITKLVPVTGAISSDLQAGYWIGMLGILMLPLSPFRLLAEASQRSYFANLFLGIQSVVITSISLFLAWSKWGITGQYVALILGGIIFHVIMCWDGIRLYPSLWSFWQDRIEQRSIERQMWQLNKSTFILRISNQLSLFTDNIIIAYVMSPAMVIPFFITQKLTNLIQYQIQGVGHSSWATLAELYTQGKQEEFNDLTIKLTRVVTLMGSTLMIPIVGYNHYFIQLWVGTNRFGGDVLTILSACNGILLGILSLWIWLFTGTGMQSKVVRLNVVATIVNFTLSLICTHVFGIVGPLMGTFISSVVVSIWRLPLIMRTVFNISLDRLLAAAIKPLIVGIPYTGLIWWIANNHVPWGWPGLAFEMGLTIIVYIVLAWLLVLNKLEREDWKNRIVKLF